MLFNGSIGVRLAALGLGLAAAASSVKADVVTEWNTIYLNTARAVGGPPCPLSRSAALMHIAMYDALESIDHRYTPLVVKDYVAPVGANRKAAIVSAAHDVLTAIYPARAAIYDAARTASLAQIPAGPSRDAGVAAGSAVAARVLADHADDQPFMTDTNYVYGTGPGAYVPTYPDYTSPPFSPGWGHCKPWCMLTGDQFRPTRGPLGYTVMSDLITSVRYAENYREVLNYGKRQSTARSAEQTEIAWFWANDRNGTYKPPGHLNAITQIVSAQQGLNLEQNARLFAMINAAMGDAGIVAWDGKYMTDIDLWRPITAIRSADTDGNPLTKANKNWVPLLDFSPPFPGYISGHATFGGAWAATMKAFFGNDNITFSCTSDEPAVAGVVRTFNSFSQAGYEDAESRIWLGVHFRFDAEDGYAQGYQMATSMAGQFFTRTCRADLSNDGSITATDMTMFTNAYFAGERMADFNRDGVINSLDAVDFMNAYLDGCPN
jgi:hypothetical protein